MKRLTLAAVTAAALALSGLGIAPATAVTASTGTVSVTVTGPGGVRLPAVDVNIESIGDAWGYSSGETAANGTYASGELEPGDYAVTARLSSWPITATATKNVKVTANANVAAVVNLTGFGILKGAATAKGAKIAKGSVLVEGTESYYGDVVDGAYMMYVKPGTYKVSVAPPWDVARPTFLRTYGGNTVRTVDAKKYVVANNAAATVNIATYTKVGSLTGKVVDAKGKAVAGASVSVNATNRQGWGYATTAKDGTYTVGGLPGGRYTVQAYKGGTLSSTYSTKTFAVKAGATASAGKTVVRKNAAGTSKITLKIKASKTVWKRGSVCATALTSKGLWAGGACATSKTKKLTIPGLAQGTYKVTLDGTNTSQKISVKKGKTTTKTVTRANGTTISGTVKTASGKVLKKGYVSIYDANGTHLGNVQTTSKGRYTVPGAVSGKYTVTATSSKVSEGVSVSKTITVKKGKKATASLKLVKTAKITGKVTNSKGVGIAGVTVMGVSTAGDYTSATTNSKGQYTLTGLHKGTVSVSTHDPYDGGYLNGKVVKVKVATGKSKKASTVKLAAG